MVAAMWALLGAVLVGFFLFLGHFGPSGQEPTLWWLKSSWKENNYDHAPLVGLVIAWLLWRARPAFLAETAKPAVGGLIFVLAGLAFFVVGWRMIQPRVNVVALPVIIYGAVVFVYGWARARHWIFPLSMVAFVIPVPGIEQMTSGLQIIATKLAHFTSGVLGMTTQQAGSRIYGDNGSWEVDEGCSGIRSIVALTLVTYVYGMIAHQKWSERLVVFAACIPIAIMANAVRLTSILIVGRFNLEFAKTTWHDYSGFMSFGAALALLMLLSTVMRKGLKALRPKVTVTKVTRPSGAGEPAVPASSDPF
jgi:exosortase